MLGSIVSLVLQKNASGTTGAPVTVMNTPLPVTGSVNAAVTGTVASQQSGNWNVGITGTPNVSITNSPTVGLAAGSSVNVSNPLNTSNNPTPFATLDAFQPYEDQCFAFFGGAFNKECSFKAIPAGKRLVIQEVDADIAVDPGLKPFIEVTPNGIGHFLTLTFQGSSTVDIFTTHQETRLYAGQNATPFCRISLSGSSSNGFFSCVFSGFLVDVPAS